MNYKQEKLSTNKLISPLPQATMPTQHSTKGDFSMSHNIPTMMTIREVARTGILSEYTIRALVKQGRVPCVKAGVKVLINFELFCEQLNNPQQLCS